MGNVIQFIIISLFVISCGNSNRVYKSATYASLESVQQLYLQEASGYQTDSHGFIYTDECDSLLFSSLYAISRGQEFDILAARDSEGAWHRRPAMDCHLQENGSSISRDMLVGVMAYSLYFHRLDILEDMWQYGNNHNWKMGIDQRLFDTRTILTPNLGGLLARAIKHLGGSNHLESRFPPVYTSTPGFESHLTLLQIWMEGRIAREISNRAMSTLDSILDHSPNNPLANAMYHKFNDGNQSKATELLLNTWPQDKLPTSTNWCSRWRTQRADDDSSFEPCPTEGRIHSGGDLLFTIMVITEE